MLEIDWRLLSAKACQDLHIGYATSMLLITTESRQGNLSSKEAPPFYPLHGLQIRCSELKDGFDDQLWASWSTRQFVIWLSCGLRGTVLFNGYCSNHFPKPMNIVILAGTVARVD